MNNIVLLTATIQPKADQPNLKLVNSDERLLDYKKALLFYDSLIKKKVINRVIFIDNSGYDLSELVNCVDSNAVEYLSFYGLDVPKDYHRGYGEFVIIDYAYENSEFLINAKPDDVIWKITGRYIIKNLEELISKAPRKFDMYCNIRKRWMDMELIAWNKVAYCGIVKGISNQFKGAMAPELIFPNVITSANDEYKVVSKYYWPPLIEGRRGGDGSEFQGPRSYIKFTLLVTLKLIMLPMRRALDALRWR